jgi:N-acylglucosamine-6-phosphate 2-epimerase
MKGFADLIPRGLVVSVQLDDSEPLHTPQHCALFAQAAMAGGAVAIRGEGIANLPEIRATTRIPLIGCTRSSYDDGWVLVTPDMQSVDTLVRLGMDVIAIDATLRIRPNGLDGIRFLAEVRKRHPNLLILADVSGYEEGIHAADVGANALSTVLYGRTQETYELSLDLDSQLDLISRLSHAAAVPVLAEGFIWSTAVASRAIEAGAYGLIVGGAIPRPRVITQRSVTAVDERLGG